jgi:hypothetical protein
VSPVTIIISSIGKVTTSKIWSKASSLSFPH